LILRAKIVKLFYCFSEANNIQLYDFIPDVNTKRAGISLPATT